MRTVLIVFLLLVYVMQCPAQINGTDNSFSFSVFNINTKTKTINGKQLTLLAVSKNGEVVITDSVVTDIKNCSGFSFPDKQPVKGYFIFSKRERKNGKTYILTQAGDYKVTPGGAFWAAPKHKVLFMLAERDNTNLVVYSLTDLKVLFEKYNCDEFTGWYFKHGSYFGKVVMECGEELENEKEISEWMHPVEVERYDVKTHQLNEVHLTEGDFEHVKPLMRFAACK